MAKRKSSKGKTHKDNSPVEWTKQERVAIGEFVAVISSARPRGDTAALFEEGPFLYGSSKINMELAQAARFELSGELDDGEEGSGFYEMTRSPMFWKLRDAFVEDAKKGDKYSLVRVAWRAYNAGLLSVDRMTLPPTSKP